MNWLRARDRVYYLLVYYYPLKLLQVGPLHGAGVSLVQRVALLLVLHHAGVGLAELLLVEGVAEALACLGHLLLYLFVVLCYLVLNQVVGAVALLRVAVVYQRVVESVHVAAGLPYRGVHEYGGVYAHDVVVEQHHALPPILLDVVLKLHAHLAVVVDGGQAVVDVAAGEHESVLLAVRHDFLENVFLCHSVYSVLNSFCCL